MYCPKCGNKMSEGVKFCSKCGASLEKAPGLPQPPGKPASQHSGGKKPRTGVFIALAVVFLLAGVGGGGYIGYQVYQRLADQGASDDGWGSADTVQKETEDKGNTREAEETAAADGSTASSVMAADEGNATANVTEVDENETTSAAAAWSVNTAAETVISQAGGEYILPDSDKRLLSNSDIANLTPEKLRLARNEIYAKHGRKFKDEGLQSYFDSQPWYKGTIEPDRFSDDAILNDIERKNLDLIKAREAVLN